MRSIELAFPFRKSSKWALMVTLQMYTLQGMPHGELSGLSLGTALSSGFFKNFMYRLFSSTVQVKYGIDMEINSTR